MAKKVKRPSKKVSKQSVLRKLLQSLRNLLSPKGK